MKARTLLNLLLGFMGLLLLLGANAWVARTSMADLIASQEWVAHTYSVLREVQGAVSMAKDVETSTRGYVITANPEFLQPYRAVSRRIGRRLAPLSALTIDNPLQHKRVQELSRLITDELAISKSQIDMVASGHKAQAQRMVALGKGKRAMDLVRAKAMEIEDEEQLLLGARALEYQDSAQRAQATFWISLAANFALLSFVCLSLARARHQGEQLASAHEELKRVEGMRDSLTAMLVHDLRTPLTTILGPLEMLGSHEFGELGREQAEVIAMSTASAQRLLGLVNELLHISKMEAGELKVRRDSLHAEAIIEEAIGSVAQTRSTALARIERDVPSDLPLMQADQEMLARVLTNLLGNALKFTPSNGQITISARTATPLQVLPARLQPTPALASREVYRRPSILFSVRDTGEGIPAADLDRVFEKFGQVETRRAGRKMSTGLGLTFCRLAIEAHGGLIWVESTPGQGSDFRFTVPLHARDDEPTQPPARPGSHASPALA